MSEGLNRVVLERQSVISRESICRAEESISEGCGNALTVWLSCLVQAFLIENVYLPALISKPADSLLIEVQQWPRNLWTSRS